MPQGPIKKITPELAKKLVKIAAWFIAVMVIYILIIKYQSFVGTVLLYLVTGVLFIVCIVLNGGLNKDIPTPEMLRDDWSPEKKERFISNIVKGKNMAKELMYVLLPMLVAVMIDLVYLFWIDQIL